MTQVDFIKKSKYYQENKVISRFGILDYDNPNNIILKDYFDIIVIEVDAKENISYTNVNKRFELWRQLIGAETIEELNQLAKKDPIIKEVVEKMKLFSKKKYIQTIPAKERLIRSQIESRDEIIAEQDKIIASQKESSKEEVKKNKIEIARNLMEVLPVEEIAKATNLPIKEIQKLKEE